MEKKPADTPNTDPTLLLTVDEVARHLRIGRNSVYKLILSGQLRTISVGRRRRLCPRHEVERYIAAQLAEEYGDLPPVA
jgi:excisionase family DNA binding protein